MRRHRVPAVLACVGLGLALMTGLVACSDDDSSDSSSIPVYHDGDSIEVANGKRFIVALDANPSTGFSWEAGDNANVTFVSSRQVNKPSAPPGATGTQELTLKATKTGSSTLELAYSRSFEGGVPPAKTASFDVTVT